MTTETELRHLLEMAAKACGIQVDERGPFTEVLSSRVWQGEIENVRRDWNPHTDDGDSARMRSALLIDVDWLIELGENGVTSFGVMCWNGKSANELFADHNGDRNAALRLCALKVAAGRQDHLLPQ